MKSFKLFFLIIFYLSCSKISLGSFLERQDSHPQVDLVFQAIYSGDLDKLRAIHKKNPFQYDCILDGAYEFSPFDTALHSGRFDSARCLLELASKEDKAKPLFKINRKRLADVGMKKSKKLFISAALKLQGFVRKLLARQNKKKNSSELEEAFSGDGKP